MSITKVIMGGIAIIIGLVLLPVVAAFINAVTYDQYNGTGAWNVTDKNISAISGLTSLLNLVGYGFAFGLVGLGVGMIVYGFKN